MKGIFSRLFFSVFFVGLASPAAWAFPVDGAFGGASKAIYFTGTAVPTNATTLEIGDGAAGSNPESGIVMTPVGDGSWVCTATVFPGAQYKYTFEYRIARYDDTTFVDTEPGGRRNVDYTRTITLPDTAKTGYYIYNTFQDISVYGRQENDTTVLNTNNPFLRNWSGVDLLAGDADTGDVDNDNIFNVSATQVGDSAFAISWSFAPSQYGEVSPVVDGDLIFDTTQTAKSPTSSPRYGYRVLRAPETTPVAFTSLVFEDITTTITGGDTNITSDSSQGWPSTTLTAKDDPIPNYLDTWVYTVVFFSAYRHLQATADQNFAGGYDTAVRRPGIKVFFVVENMNHDVVFPDGRRVGTVYVTPYVEYPDGTVVRRGDLRTRGVAILAVRKRKA